MELLLPSTDRFEKLLDNGDKSGTINDGSYLLVALL
jgi:hypothetical protein